MLKKIRYCSSCQYDTEHIFIESGSLQSLDCLQCSKVNFITKSVMEKEMSNCKKKATKKKNQKVTLTHDQLMDLPEEPKGVEKVETSGHVYLSEVNLDEFLDELLQNVPEVCLSWDSCLARDINVADANVNCWWEEEEELSCEDQDEAQQEYLNKLDEWVRWNVREHFTKEED